MEGGKTWRATGLRLPRNDTRAARRYEADEFPARWKVRIFPKGTGFFEGDRFFRGSLCSPRRPFGGKRSWRRLDMGLVRVRGVLCAYR